MVDLALRGISKTYGQVRVVKDVDLDVAHGEFVVFVGPSGCGKSTLLRMVAGLEPITAGDLVMGGRRVNALPPAERRVAMVFQSYALYPHLTVFDNMAFGLRYGRTRPPRAEVEAKVRRAAASLQLTELLGRRPRALSGGQRQRVAIGRAIVRDPDLFLFDEPLSNLDAALRAGTRVEVAKLHRELGATMIYVTHDQVEAMTLADRIVVLNEGRVEQVGAPLELYHRPRNLFVAAFIGSPRMNLLPGRVSGQAGDSVDVVLAGGGRARSAVGGSGDSAVTVGVRPEHLHEGAGDGLSLEAEVEAVEHLGEFEHALPGAGGRHAARHARGRNVAAAARRAGHARDAGRLRPPVRRGRRGGAAVMPVRVLVVGTRAHGRRTRLLTPRTPASPSPGYAAVASSNWRCRSR